MNRSGFTTIEVIIASALIITLITGGAVGMRQMNLLNQVASTRTSHTEMRTRVLGALSNSNGCAAALGNPILVSPALPITVSEIKDEMGVVVLENNKAPPGIPSDGLVYKLALLFPPTGVPDASFKGGLGRILPTRRFSMQLEIRGERKNLKEMGGMQADVVGRIPLSAEFETGTNKLVSCTTRHDDMDDELVGGVHTVRDCLKADGMPMPTAIGLICRIPVPTAIQTVKGYKGAIPSCNSLVPGWNNAAAPNNYNTTIPIDVEGRGCKGTVKGVTGWHSMSPVPVESKTIRIKKGTSDLLSILLGGTAFSALVVVAFVPVVGWIIAAAVLLVAFIFSLFKKCKKQNFTFYAQVNGVGCI